MTEQMELKKAARRKVFAARALELVEAAALRVYGMRDDTVVCFAELLAVKLEEAWLDGIGDGVDELQRRFREDAARSVGG